MGSEKGCFCGGQAGDVGRRRHSLSGIVVGGEGGGGGGGGGGETVKSVCVCVGELNVAEGEAIFTTLGSAPQPASPEANIITST